MRQVFCGTVLCEDRVWVSGGGQQLQTETAAIVSILVFGVRVSAP